jgi:hypothetical protein
VHGGFLETLSTVVARSMDTEMRVEEDSELKEVTRAVYEG